MVKMVCACSFILSQHDSNKK